MYSKLFSPRVLWSVRIVVCAIVGVFFILEAAIVQAAVETARPAQEFVDSIGINIHLGYTTGIYGQYSTIIKPRLEELGVSKVRDGYIQSWPTTVKDRMKDLAQSGFKINIISNPSQATSQQIHTFVTGTLGAATVASVEGINEPDLSGQANWATTTRTNQASLYSTFKNASTTAHIPVLGSAVTTEVAAKTLGDMTSTLDQGNLHPYYGGRNPETGGWGANGYGSLSWAVQYIAQPVSKAKPVAVTETGLHNAASTTSGFKYTPESVGALYIPRTYLYYFNKGVTATYIYELADEGVNKSNIEYNFGLIRNDGTPKPAFYTLKNLIALLTDTGSTFTPGSLDYTLTGSTTNVHKALFQKSDGNFYVVLWLGKQNWNPDTKVLTLSTSQNVTIQLGTPIAAAQSVISNDSMTWNTLPVTNNSVNVSVQDKVTIIKLVPAVPQFKMSDRARVEVPVGSSTNVYALLGGARAGTQARGATSTIVAGPTWAQGSIWWQADFDTGVDGWVDEAHLQFVDTQAPTIPGFFMAAGSSTPSRIILTWDASTDNVGVMGYRIYRNSSLLAVSTTTSYVDKNVCWSCWYNYNIAAYDAAGNVSLRTKSIEIKTPAY